MRLLYSPSSDQRPVKVQLLLYPDSGHGVHFQYPEDFVAEATRFLDQNADGAPT
jgi:pimeloyl-ACP methyl ester carboxylesterase